METETENTEQSSFKRKDSAENTEQKSEQRKEEQQSKTQNTNQGFDFSSLLNDKNLSEILKHLLSGGGAMAGNYFLWIKPIQDKLEAMNKKIEEQQKQIKELEQAHKQLKRDLNFEQVEKEFEKDEASVKGTEDEYFNIKPRHGSRLNKYKQRNAA